MEQMTVSEVSRTFGVSTRMLRYYESKGLIQSARRDDYAYRIYDENAVRRLQLILVFRKLRIPLKQIAVIISDVNGEAAAEILRMNIAELDGEVAALNTIRDILKAFVQKFEAGIGGQIRLDLLKDNELTEAVHILSLSKYSFKEECSMNELNNANEYLKKSFEVRPVLLPPFTVAAYQFIGENPETNAGDVVDKFIRESGLYIAKPDSRMFGFNHPNPSETRKDYGYEVWVTIPEDMEVPAPLMKKRFDGGLYLAHTIDFPEFQEWGTLIEYVNNSEKYALNFSELGEEIMGGCLEEHLNWIYSSHMGWPENGIDGKIDLLVPVRIK